MIDRMQAFLGHPTKFNESYIHSPNLDEIAIMGYMEYMIKLNFSLFDKEKILLDMFGMDENEYDSIESSPDYHILTDHPQLREHIIDSIEFFTKSKVSFDSDTGSFLINGIEFINENTYLAYVDIIKQLNVVESNSDNGRRKTAKAKSFQDRINFFKKKAQKKEDVLEIKDILSILCNAGINGINIFNVGTLSIYQMYEEFERLNVKESFSRLLPVWANGHLGESNKLPEWIKRTKL
ncbi:hypothetical protein [Paenibacillus sp. LK1]|uniref:hypothetical protein n=1 Tax=Paenibacillus sp. LK1 TaxID=2053014 RepID=UPI000C1A041F|nr:hypothetical protein [Paenibacillus sp. LK1]PIH59677.1 hypothetical protein CS562_06985 [Paenibacillus sp. LK1]